MKLPLTGDEAADRLLEDDPLALLIGMLLDQQVTMEKAFHSPYDLKERLGGRLDAAEIAAMDPDKLREVFAERPALHRFPGSMAGRTQEMTQALVEHYDGRAERVWETAKDGGELLANLKELPGFGDQKAKIFVALLAKRMGVQPRGWEEAAGFYAKHGCYSVADVDGPDTLAKVREYKKAAKAEAKAKAKASKS
ncbi:MAG: Fe-S cluster assembly protein HesB [Acidimicrobiia bacterium]|nr:Fe-S cluster assembly protein HesB [Acidimicrobiia bacterium]MBV8984866.1 Fe-S cluster assembly protein HesB [Acidimicrobiia bacterium]MBV9039816.1 Fe-S cluster assembly protein HesB [Acidimicrobiia bacterium]